MARADERIKKDVVEELYWDDRVDASKVEVAVEGAVVALSGRVPTWLSRRAAEEDALAILGVGAVDNRVEVRYPAGATVPTDGELARALYRRLAWNPDIEVADLDIDVQAGVVTLRGSCEAYWKKYYAEELVVCEPGVVLINNLLSVVPPGDVRDKDIAGDITRSLDARAAVSAEDVSVSVRNGHVVLDGTVPSQAARQAAQAAAAFTAGVQGVENRLRVE